MTKDARNKPFPSPPPRLDDEAIADIIKRTERPLATGKSPTNLAEAIRSACYRSNLDHTWRSIPSYGARRTTLDGIRSSLESLRSRLAEVERTGSTVRIHISPDLTANLGVASRVCDRDNREKQAAASGVPVEIIEPAPPLDIHALVAGLVRLEDAVKKANDINDFSERENLRQGDTGPLPKTLFAGKHLPKVFEECFGETYGNGESSHQPNGPGNRFVVATLDHLGRKTLPGTIRSARTACLNAEKEEIEERYPQQGQQD